METHVLKIHFQKINTLARCVAGDLQFFDKETISGVQQCLGHESIYDAYSIMDPGWLRTSWLKRSPEATTTSSRFRTAAFAGWKKQMTTLRVVL